MQPLAENSVTAPQPMAITVTPIGYVRNDQEEPIYINWGDIISQVVIDEQHAEALQGLNDYSHLMVVFWMDQVCYSKPTHVPQGKHEQVPEVGIFACRCPYRPNPIGITSVPILSIENNILTVRGLDAVNMTPVLDLKPYTPQYDWVSRDMPHTHPDRRKDIRVPEWVGKLTY